MAREAKTGANRWLQALPILWLLLHPGARAAAQLAGPAEPAAPTVAGTPDPARPPQETPAPPPDAPASREADPREADPREADAQTTPVRAGTAILVETDAQGVDPVVGRFVTTQLKGLIEARGYTVAPLSETRTQMVDAGLHYPPKLGALWQLTYLARAERGVHAQVWAEAGRYVVRVAVASENGTGPYLAQATATHEDMAEVLSGMLPGALPPPGEGLPEQDNTRADARDAQAGLHFFDTGIRPRRRGRFYPYRLAVAAEPAFGMSRDGFFNQLLGVRLDYRFGRDLSLGGHVAYANLRGRHGRVGGVLTYLQLDNRMSVVRGSRLQIPLRGGLGYLWRNGPVLRLATGIAFPVGRRAEVVLDLIAPTFWMLPEQTLFSLDLAVEVAWKF